MLSGAFLLSRYAGELAPAVPCGHPHSPSSADLDGPAGPAPGRLLQSQSQHQVSSSHNALNARDSSGHIETRLPVLLRAQQEMAEQLSSHRQLSIGDSGT